MAKQDEIRYLNAVGESGREFALNKPFSVEECGDLLMKIGFVSKLLPPPPARLLDFGCGTGWTSCFLSRMGYSVTGQDISPDMIDAALENKRRFEAADLEFVVADFEELTYDGEFDAALFFDCLHHAVDEQAALKSAYRALKPGGTCVTHEPGTGHAEDAHTKNEVKKYNVTEKDMPPKKIIQMGEQLGFTSCEIFPFPDEALTAMLSYHDGSAAPIPGDGFFERKRHRKRFGRMFVDLYPIFSNLDECGIVRLKK